MRKLSFTILSLLIFISLLLPAYSFSYENEIRDLSTSIAQNMDKIGRKTVTVADFTDPEGNVTPIGKYIADELSADLKAIAKGFNVLERAELASILAKNKLALTTPYNPNTVKQIGQAGRVGAIVMGTITTFEDSIKVTINLISTYTTKVVVSKTANIPKTKKIRELLGDLTLAPALKKEVETTIAKPKKPIGDDLHFIQSDDYFISENPLENREWIYVNLAKLLTPATAQTMMESEFFQVADGKKTWTAHYWSTRMASENDLKLSMEVIIPDLTGEGGVYRAPKNNDESRRANWFMARITDTSTLYKGYVTVSGGYKVSPMALRVIVEK